mmetsp:Transcript_96678/g.255317  ORF Transcript_96678/g.255317 Transcript_96678/m.255317 type:complete len:80 (+) Transcript_96678:1086-1325(+)
MTPKNGARGDLLVLEKEKADEQASGQLVSMLEAGHVERFRNPKHSELLFVGRRLMALRAQRTFSRPANIHLLPHKSPLQ